MLRGLLLFALACVATPASAQEAPQEPADEPVGTACDACVVERGRDRLCEPHALREAEVLKETRSALKSKAFAEREQALETIAALTLEHTNVPSKKVAQALASRKSDEALLIRSKVVELLSKGQHHETAVATVVRALKDAEKRWEDLDAVLLELAEEYADGRATFDPKRTQAFNEHREAMGYLTTTLSALGRLQDEAAEEALIRFLDRYVDRSPRLIMVIACTALLDLGTQRAASTVVDYLVELEQRIADHSLDNEYGLERVPNTLGGLVIGMVLPADEKSWGLIAQALDDAIQAREPSFTPDAEFGNAARWQQWLETHPQFFAQGFPAE
jgi:hypothetical protein